MPNFSFSTVLMTLLTSNILAGLIALLFRRGKTMACLGYRVLTIFVFLTVLRLLVPLEFSFSTNIYMPRPLSWAAASFRTHWIPFFSMRLSLWNMFEILWAVGTFVSLARCLHDYRCTKDYILKHGRDKTDDPDYQDILNEICSQRGRKNRFHVIELPGYNAPLLFGHREPCIILPAHLPLTSSQRYYVLSHEAMHYFHRDFLIKGALRLLAAFYWWNPACALLYRQAGILLEMHIDKKITCSAPDITAQYAQCLISIRKAAALYPRQIPRFTSREGCFFVRSKETELKRRMIMLTQDSGIWRKLRAGAAIALSAAGVYILSYCFTFEASYLPHEIAQEYQVPTKENTYAVQLDSGGYEIYINNSYWWTDTSLEYYPDGITIYNQKGDVINEN